MPIEQNKILSLIKHPDSLVLSYINYVKHVYKLFQTWNGIIMMFCNYYIAPTLYMILYSALQMYSPI